MASSTTTTTAALWRPLQQVWTDGSRDLQTGDSGCAFVYHTRATDMWHGIGVSCGVQEDSKEVELLAIEHALTYAVTHWIGLVGALEICTDNVRAIGDVEHCWNGGDLVERDWAHLPSTITICEKIEALVTATPPMSVSIVHVNAHSGIAGNDLADELAREARLAGERMGVLTHDVSATDDWVRGSDIDSNT